MEQDRYKYKVITIPNILSFVRLCLIPVFVWTYVVRHDLAWTLILLALSALTDIVDGFIARRFNMVSNVGRILDPAADKLTQLAVIACLCVRCPQLIVVAVLLVIKEVANGIVGLRMMKTHRDALDSKWHGKLATCVIYATGVAHLIWPDMSKVISYSLVALCVVIMTLSFVLYTKRNVGIIKEETDK